MIKWTYLSYREAPEEGALEEVRLWMEGLEGAVRGAIAGQMEARRHQSLKAWEEQRYWKALEGALVGLEELRFELKPGKDERKESYRILGFADESRREFTMLYGFTKTRGEKDYEVFGGIALERQRQVKTDKRYTTRAKWVENYD